MAKSWQDRLRTAKRRIGSHAIVFHAYQFLFRALLNPMNKGARLASARNYLRWFLIQKPRGESCEAALPNGLRTIVYPDSDSGVSYLFDNDVDYSENQYIRRIISKGDFIVDAGCNVGNRSLALADVIGGALLIDANPNCLERVVENLQLNGLDPDKFHTRHSAVGATNTVVRFPADSGTSCQNAIADDGDEQATVEVPMVTLDTALEEIGNPSVALLKTDLEGYDLEAFAGAKNLLASDKIKLVLFERWPSTDLEEFTGFFQGLNWEVFAIDSNGAECFEHEAMQKENNLFARPCKPV